MRKEKCRKRGQRGARKRKHSKDSPAKEKGKKVIRVRGKEQNKRKNTHWTKRSENRKREE